MILVVIAFLGGALTIFSPCILPILPFVFARADRPFVKSTLPMLAGMAITFAAVATLASAGGSWAVHANEAGRDIAIALLVVFGVTLIAPRTADVLARPFVSLGNRLSQNVTGGHAGAAGSLLLGISTGLLWTPCAGPILGLVLTGVALEGVNARTAFALLAYAAGAASSLAIALLIGGRILAGAKTSRRASERVRQGLGVAVLAGVAAIALGLGSGVLARVSYGGTETTEQTLLNAFSIASVHPAAADARSADRSGLPDEGAFPSLDGAVAWLNSAPLTPAQLRGKVVLVDFWTYSCINCIRTIPYILAWVAKYKGQGLVVIGVHTPEFAFEKNIGNVRQAIRDFKITYPVALDSDYVVWDTFQNGYWPAFYFIDANGRLRYQQFGEGNYDKAEKVIQALLAEAGRPVPNADLVTPYATGIEAAPDIGAIGSPETYIGYDKASNFASSEAMRRDATRTYKVGLLGVNEWGLSGDWTVGPEWATLDQPGGGIAYKFSARDLHLVLGPGADNKPVRFQVTIDGAAPGSTHGADIDAAGNGVVSETRLYQLVRQAGPVRERTFEIRFLDPNVRAFVFTFG
jgi:cytochrome c biogenesis protein CcdA/thiol-disulfide isomerase/thioredoxin